MVIYRPHRHSLDAAMADAVEIADRAALVRHLSRELQAWNFNELTESDIQIKPYGYDKRIGWDTYIVTLRNKCSKTGVYYFGEYMGPDYFGTIGFTSGPL